MSPKIKSQTRYYTQIIGLLGLLAVVTIGGCLSLLYLRKQTELTAENLRNLEREIVKEERKLRYLETKIAEIHQPNYLLRTIARLDLDLQPPRSEQIVYLEEKAPVRKSPDTLPGEPAKSREPFRQSYDLAVMEPIKPIE